MEATGSWIYSKPGILQHLPEIFSILPAAEQVVMARSTTEAIVPTSVLSLGFVPIQD